MVISLIGCIVQFQKRYLFMYFYLPFFLSLFFFVEDKIAKGKMVLVKRFGLILALMLILYIGTFFYLSSSPIRKNRSQGSELYLMNLDCMEQISISSMNGNLDGWLYKQSDKKVPLIIFFNGAGECSAETVRTFYEDGILSKYFPDYNFLSTDYPGYGLSDGNTSEASMKKMALDTYDTAIKWDFVDSSNITVIGYSIGTGPTSYLAAKRDLASVVMLAPYEKHWNNYVRNYERFNKPMSKTLKISARMFWGYNLDPYDYASSIDEKTLIITSMDDTTIIHEASMEVADRISNCSVITLEGVKHEHLLSDVSYEAIYEFLN